MSTPITLLCPFGLDAGLLSKAIALSEGNTRVLLPESEQALAAQMGARYIHTLPDGITVHDESAFARWLSEKLQAWGDPVILAPATVQLRSILPMTAYLLGAGLTADCTALSLTDGVLLQTRPAFGNNMLADIVTLGNVQMATVRPDTFRPLPHPKQEVTVIKETFVSDNTRVCVTEFTPFAAGAPLSQADIIIAGGLGVGSAEGFKKLTHLAEKIGAAVAASRSAVDAGFAPYRLQVGVTGVTVSPKLYIAVGISGAVQHLSGMSGAEKVIAINSDPKAPIFDYADYGIVGDWEQVIDHVLEELK